MSDDWKWHDDSTKQLTVVASVRAIAIYTNPDGDIVMRQEGLDYGDREGDDVVVIPRGSVNAIVKALKAEAAKPFRPD